MSCLTSGFLINCTNLSSVGGISAIWLANRDEVASITETNGDVTVVTMTSGDVFFPVQFVPNTAAYNETGEPTANGFSFLFNKEITFSLSRLDLASRNFVQKLAGCACGLVVIFTDQNGNSFISGFEANDALRAFRINADATTTGTALADSNEVVVTLSVSSREKAKLFTGVVPVTP